MGNQQAGSIAGCAIGSASSVLGLGANLGGCAALIAFPPALALCVGGLGIAGFVGGALGAQACKDAAQGNGKRRKRSAYYRKNFLEFEVLDTNGDGFLSNLDMPATSVPNGSLQNVIVSLMMYSHVIDSNGDGKISPQELAFFRDTVKTDRGAMQMMYRGMDSNKDGKVTADELIKVMGTCSVMGGKPDAYKSYDMSMKGLDKQKKGYITMNDMESYFQAQPKQSGQPGLWKYYASEVVQTFPQQQPQYQKYLQIKPQTYIVG